MIPLSTQDLPRSGRPYVTWALIAVNLLVFLYQLTLNDVDQLRFNYRYGVVPAELMGNLTLGNELVSWGRRTIPLDLTSPVPTWMTMFTSMFLHGGFMHLASNILFLWVFGGNVEHRFGHVRFLAFYLAAGIAAIWAQTLASSGSIVPMIGASGAIAGVLGAYLLLFPFSRVTTLVFMGLVFVAQVRALLLLGFWAVLQVFSGIGSLVPDSPMGGVAYFAHLGGFVAGLVVVTIYHLVSGEPVLPRRPRPALYWPGRQMTTRPELEGYQHGPVSFERRQTSPPREEENGEAHDSRPPTRQR